MTPKKLLAIDPGKSGGIAYRDSDIVNALVMPLHKDRSVDIVKLMNLFMSVEPREVCIERQWIRPTDGASRAAVTMSNYGGLLTIFELYKTTVEGSKPVLHLPTPKQWQKVVIPNCEKGKSKQCSVAAARNIYPTVSLLRTPKCTKPHDGMSDALCMLSWLEEGTLCGF